MPPPEERKVHVLVLVDLLVPAGGAERLAVEIALRLDPNRYRRTLCVSRWNPAQLSNPAITAILERLEAAGVEVLLIRRRGRFAVWSWLPLVRYLRRHRVDVIHSHLFGSNVWGTVIGRSTRVPVVVAHEHMWSFEGNPARRWLDRHLIGRWADAFLTVSDQSRRRMIEDEGIAPDRVRTVRNGVPDAEPGDPGKLREELALTDGTPIVGAVAVLRPEKRIDVLVRAARVLADELPDIKVVIAGDGGERAAVEALIHELDLEDVVILLGLRYDIPDLLAGLDVAVLCSDFEGGPLALMEYMRAHRPIVATRVGGTPELIEEGVDGLLVERGNHVELAEAVLRLIRDPAGAAQLGERARARQQREHDIGGMVQSIEGIYDDLLQRRRPPASAGRAEADLVHMETRDSLEAAQSEWSALAGSCQTMFSTWEWADAWWRSYGDGYQLELRVCRGPDGEVAAILPLCRRRRGPVNVVRYVGHGPADRLGPVATPEYADAAYGALKRELRDLKGLTAFLGERMAAAEVPSDHPGTVVRTESSPVLRFEGSWEEFLASRSRNFRDQARRRERRLAATGQLRFRLADASSLDRDMSALFDLHHARWEKSSSGAFDERRQRFHRDFAQRALERGWLRLWMLELDGRPAAAWYGFRFANAEWYYQSGRDPAHDKDSVGFVLMLHTIREAFNDGLTKYHLLRGDEGYKSRFANDDELLVTLLAARNPALERALELAAGSWTHLPTIVKRASKEAVGG